MNNLTEICSGKPGCSYDIIHACTCGDPIVFLCRDCTLNHLSEPSTHTFISLSQARELLMENLLPEDFNTRISEYNLIKLELQRYLKTLHSYQQQIQSFKYEAFRLIEQTCDATINLLSLQKESAESHLNGIKLRMKTFTSLEDQDLVKFQSQGLGGIVEGYIHSFKINQDFLSTAIQNMFSISNSPPDLPEDIKNSLKPSNSCIYIPRCNTKKLLKYDLSLNRAHISDLHSSISKNFEGTSSCILPNNTILLVGGANPNHGDTYLFHPSTSECIKLRSLNTSRGYVGLYCYDNYIYAMGGYTTYYSNKAERMEIEGNGWKNLADMIEPRDAFSCYGTENRIYLFGGNNTGSVEYYDIISNSFCLVRDLRVNPGDNVLGEVDGRIFIINQHLIVLDKSFRILEEVKDATRRNYLNLTNVVVKGKDIVFYSAEDKRVYNFNTQRKEIREAGSI